MGGTGRAEEHQDGDLLAIFLQVAAVHGEKGSPYSVVEGDCQDVLLHGNGFQNLGLRGKEPQVHDKPGWDTEKHHYHRCDDGNTDPLFVQELFHVFHPLDVLFLGFLFFPILRQGAFLQFVELLLAGFAGLQVFLHQSVCLGRAHVVVVQGQQVLNDFAGYVHSNASFILILAR